MFSSKTTKVLIKLNPENVVICHFCTLHILSLEDVSRIVNQQGSGLCFIQCPGQRSSDIIQEYSAFVCPLSCCSFLPLSRITEQGIVKMLMNDVRAHYHARLLDTLFDGHAACQYVNLTVQPSLLSACLPMGQLVSSSLMY